MAILGQQNPNTYRTANVFTATLGQTVFQAHYNPTTVDVYQNGAKLIPVIDFTANNGTSVILSAPAMENDVVEIVAYKVNLHHVDFTSAPIYLSTDANLSHGLQYIVTATANLTLPSNPLPNHSIRILNASGVQTVVVHRNGQKIHNLADDLQIDITDTSVTLIFVNEQIGWWVI